MVTRCGVYWAFLSIRLHSMVSEAHAHESHTFGSCFGASGFISDAAGAFDTSSITTSSVCGTGGLTSSAPSIARESLLQHGYSFLRSAHNNSLFSFFFPFPSAPRLAAFSIFSLHFLSFPALSSSLQTRMHATLISLLNSCTGFKNASSVAGRRMRALFSVCRVKPSGIVTGTPSDALDELAAIEYNLTQPIRLSDAALRQRSARMAKAFESATMCKKNLWRRSHSKLPSF